MMYEDKANEPSAVYWIFPVEIFKCFEEVLF